MTWSIFVVDGLVNVDSQLPNGLLDLSTKVARPPFQVFVCKVARPMARREAGWEQAEITSK